MFYFLVFFIIFSWGFAGFLDKLALNLSNVLSVQVLWTIIGVGVSLMSLPLVFVLFRNLGPMTVKPKLLFIIGVGALIYVLAGITYVWILYQRPASWVIPVTAVYPVITVIMAKIFLGESLTNVQLLGLISIVVGLVLMGK